MNKEKVYKNNKGQDAFRVNGSFNVIMVEEYLHPKYSLKTDKGKITETGLLVIFELKTDIKTLPCFIGRWDQKEERLDVDMLSLNKKDVLDFKKEKNGYSGHHPERISESPRLFQIEIKIPERTIMKGNMKFNISYGHHPDLFKL